MRIPCPSNFLESTTGASFGLSVFVEGIVLQANKINVEKIIIVRRIFFDFINLCSGKKRFCFTVKMGNGIVGRGREIFFQKSPLNEFVHFVNFFDARDQNAAHAKFKRNCNVHFVAVADSNAVFCRHAKNFQRFIERFVRRF